MTSGKSIGGWLILVGIGVVISPIRLGIYFGNTFPPVFRDGTYELLSTPGTEIYHPLWIPLIWGEIIVNILILFASVYLIFLFFSKKKFFPKFYIFLSIFSFVFILIDAMLVKIVLPDLPIFDADTTKELARAIIQIMIWVPYMLISKRVKETFIN